MNDSHLHEPLGAASLPASVRYRSSWAFMSRVGNMWTERTTREKAEGMIISILSPPPVHEAFFALRFVYDMICITNQFQNAMVRKEARLIKRGEEN